MGTGGSREQRRGLAAAGGVEWGVWGGWGLLPPPRSPPRRRLSASRSASKGSPSSAADLQDFFTRVFQGTSGPMPGGFPSPPPPAAPPGAAAAAGAPPRTEGGAPKGDAKHKRRKKVRRPFQR